MLPLEDLRTGAAFARPSAAADPRFLQEAQAIVERVRADKDAALVALTRELDGAELDSFGVPVDEIADSARHVPDGLRAAIDDAAGRLRELAAAQLPREWGREEQGVRFGEVVRPLRSAGAYVPGGRAAYPSTVLMTCIPARVAGVERVTVCTPPAPDGSVMPAILYACLVAEVSEVHRVGGAQAIAALAYGTESIAPVDIVVGPGNAWVTAAKALVASAGVVGIDGLAGPSELVVVADRSADPDVLADDLIAQAEHDPFAEASVVTWDEEVVAPVRAALERAEPRAARRDVLAESLPRVRALLTRDEEHAAEVVDAIAPEHLQVVTEDPHAFLKRVRAFGAAFLGPHTPVPLGDYGVGSNHVLPTLGTARFASGLRAVDFVRVSSVVEADREGLAAVAPGVAALARAEGLEGHARAVEARFR